MRIVGMTRVRNEQLIIEDTVEHLLRVCDHLIVLDDASVDETATIAAKVGGEHVTVVTNEVWALNRSLAETRDRARLVDEALKYRPDWLLYLDADERIDGDLRGELRTAPSDISGIRLKLFDAYLTRERHEAYSSGRLEDLSRLYGPEFRSILVAWRSGRAFRFLGNDQREPVPGLRERIATGEAAIKHFGKAISVQQWEETCEYYATHFPEPYRSKWRARIGHPFASRSIEDRPLVEWPAVGHMKVPLAVPVQSRFKFFLRRGQTSILSTIRRWQPRTNPRGERNQHYPP